MPLSAYEKWADKLTRGFFETDQFLRHLGFHDPKFLPYRAQVIPLAATLTLISDRWLEPRVQDKLARWYWCGVFGELYGSASETRIALDLQGLLRWIDDPASPSPTTVIDAGFQASRLDTMRSRTSAAYRGLYVLIQHRGAKDFFWKARMVDLDRNEKGIDIHHIFPKKWCLEAGISPRVFNSIINKTAISYKANRKIGGSAPSEYLLKLQQHKAVQLDDRGMDAILRSNFIDPQFLRADDFVGFFEARRATLLSLIEESMGKRSISPGDGGSENGFEVEDDEDEAEVVVGQS
jgi:hypothetical protein